MAVSSSSAPIAGVLDDHVEDRRGQVGEHVAPQVLQPQRRRATAPAATRSAVMSGARNDVRIVRSIMAASVVVVAGVALLGLRLQQERAVDDDGLARA